MPECLLGRCQGVSDLRCPHFGGLADHECGIRNDITDTRIPRTQRPSCPLYPFSTRTEEPLDAPGPGADRGIAAAVGMQNRERVGRARLAANSHEDATPGRH